MATLRETCTCDPRMHGRHSFSISAILLAAVGANLQTPTSLAWEFILQTVLHLFQYMIIHLVSRVVEHEHAQRIYAHSSPRLRPCSAVFDGLFRQPRFSVSSLASQTD